MSHLCTSRVKGTKHVEALTSSRFMETPDDVVDYEEVPAGGSCSGSNRYYLTCIVNHRIDSSFRISNKTITIISELPNSGILTCLHAFCLPGIDRHIDRHHERRYMTTPDEERTAKRQDGPQKLKPRVPTSLISRSIGIVKKSKTESRSQGGSNPGQNGSIYHLA